MNMSLALKCEVFFCLEQNEKWKLFPDNSSFYFRQVDVGRRQLSRAKRIYNLKIRSFLRARKFGHHR